MGFNSGFKGLKIVLIFIAQQPPVGQGFIIEIHNHTHTPHAVRLLWTSDQPVAETST